jgi:pilus assembly protein FimV
LAFTAPVASAAGLGRISVQSALGQPLRAEVELTAVSAEEAASLAVKLASAAAFQQANLDFNPALAGVRVALDRRGEGRYVVRITSQTAVSEPYLDLLLELTSSTGRVLREYTILLDPPALRTAQEVVAPSAARPAAPAAATAAAAAPASRPAPAAPATAGASSVTVNRGDTLGSIAEKTRPAAASLDQMLVALFRANPAAFIGSNMNNLRAGAVLSVPQEPQVLATDPAAARREVAAQSADFERYRARLAQAATETAPTGTPAAAQGRVTTRVEDRAAPPPSGDQLKIAQPAAATKAGDEAVARDRQIKDLLGRVAELERNNQQLQRALELQSKTGAQVQAAAEGQPAGAAPVQAPPATATPPAPAAGAAPPPAPAAAPAPPPAAEAPKPVPAKAPTPAEAPGLLEGLLGPNAPVVAGLGAAVVGLLGFWAYRRRRSAGSRESYELGDEAAQGNSLFGQTGGRSIDTGSTSNFNSSFIPPATQLDSTEVDPVAEADVYIAYGREEQAEDILKEALRVQPDRHPARVKLMELLANRGDKAAFARHAAELKTRTGGAGEDWERAAVIGRALDPSSSVFGAATAGNGDTAGREVATTVPSAQRAAGVETGGFAPKAVPLGAATGAGSRGERAGAAPSPARTDSALASDSQLDASTILPFETRATAPGMTLGGNSLPLTDGASTRLSALEFETIAPAAPTTVSGVTTSPPTESPLEYDLRMPTTLGGMSTKLPKMPDIDLNLTSTPTTVQPTRPAATAPMGEALDFGFTPERPTTGRGFSIGGRSGPATRSPKPAVHDETAGSATLLGGLTALPEGMTRMAPNTDQATVPLIDFDLTGADLPLNTTPSRAGALTGSPMAAQIATKLDLARGYIDLGVKDGARELLEEVMREGTREQRQAAVELMKQIDR